MPFRKRARFTMENRSEEALTVYYQINYTLTEVPEDCAYFTRYTSGSALELGALKALRRAADIGTL